MKDGSVRKQVVASGNKAPTVSMRVINKLAEMVEQAGVSRASFVRAAGIDAEQLQSVDAQVSRLESYRIHELALDLTGDPALGLHWAERVRPDTFGPLSYLVAHAPDLRRGYESSSKFARLISSDENHEIIEHGGLLTIRCRRAGDESLRIERFAAEMTTGIFFRIARDFGVQAAPLAVHFAYAAPDYREEYTRFFGRDVHFAQAFSGLVFDSVVLAQASPYRDEEIHEALRAIAEQRMSSLTHSLTYARRVRDFLVERGLPARGCMQSVARALGLSMRSLRRRLTTEGTSYPALENEAFGIVAKQRLSDAERTIKDTAQDMGFSDVSAFHRAFKRATGTTPAEFRQGLRSPRRPH
jgi:AraC-like DNA-binding protein